MTNHVQAWVDGSVYPRNPGTISSGAVVLISRAHGLFSVKSEVDFEIPATNNRGEIIALLCAVRLIKPTKKPVLLDIYSDSQYALEGLNKIINTSSFYNKNSDLWQMLAEEVLSRKSVKINSIHVPGHTGIKFNEVAHKFAYCAAVLQKGIFIDKVKNLEEISDVLKEEQGRVKEYKNISS